LKPRSLTNAVRSAVPMAAGDRLMGRGRSAVPGLADLNHSLSLRPVYGPLIDAQAIP